MANVIDKLKELSRKAKEFDGEHAVSIPELLSPAFLSKHTQFASADEFFGGSGIDFDAQGGHAVVLKTEEWNAYIRSISPFDNWSEMLQKASAEWATRKLGLKG